MSRPDLLRSPPGVLLLPLALQPGLSQGARRRFFGQFRRTAHHLGLIFIRHRSLCALLARTRPIEPHQEQALLNWLTDQTEPAHIVLHRPQPVAHYLAQAFAVRSANPHEVLTEPEQAQARRRVQALVRNGWGLWIHTVDQVQEAP